MHASATIHPLTNADRSAVRGLLSGRSYTHNHYDWRKLDDWLRDPGMVGMVAEQESRAVACLGVTPVPGGAAWLRIIALAHDQRRTLLDNLWADMRVRLEERLTGPVGVLVFDRWFEDHLRRWNFTRANTIVTLRHRGAHHSPPLPSSISVRQAGQRDIPTIADVDSAAFESLWRHDEGALRLAEAEAATFDVAEADGQIVGYQLSTQHGRTGHLARLAVIPQMQGRGIGARLASNALTHFEKLGIHEVTVNTQGDNHASQHLYQRMGFRRTNHSVPVWTLTLTND